MGLTAASVVHANLRDPSEPGLYARLSLELESRLQTREALQEAVITLGPRGRDIRLWGELTEGTAARLARLLAANPDVERIHLTSEGGLVDEGEAIGEVIAHRRLSTYVPDYCVSACTLAFIRGRERFVVAHARLGFHAPYEQGLFGQDFQADSTPERATYLAAGIETEFVDAALKVRSEDLWIPGPERLVSARVATAIVDLHRFPDSTLDEGPDLPHAQAAILRNFTLLQSIARSAPDIVDGIASWYLEAYRSGLPEAEAVATLKRLSAAAVASAVRDADDTTTIALGRLLVKAMRQPGDEQSCRAIGADANLVLAYETLRKIGDDGVRRLVDGTVARVALPTAGRADARRSEIIAWADDLHAFDCAAIVRRYERALAMPPRAAAIALRRMLLGTSGPQPSREASARPR